MRRVVAIGAGGAGLSVALEAARSGAEVTVFDVGGATAMAGGVVYAAGTRVQQSAGVQDDLDDLFACYMAITAYQLEPRLCDCRSLRISSQLKGHFPYIDTLNPVSSSVDRGLGIDTDHR